MRHLTSVPNAPVRAIVCVDPAGGLHSSLLTTPIDRGAPAVWRAWCSSGLVTEETAPPNPDASPEMLVTWAATRFEREGILILPGGSVTAQAFASGVLFAGWKGTPPDMIGETGFGTYYRGGQRSTVVVGFPLLWDETRVPIMAGWPPPGGGPRAGIEAASVLAYRLARYHQLTGGVWRGTAGLSGIGNLRETVAPEEGRPLWQLTVPESLQPAFYGVADLNWHREPSVLERERPFVHFFDARWMHLAAAGGAVLGWSHPVRPDVARRGEQGAGIYRIKASPDMTAGDKGPPIIPPSRVDSEGTAWVTGPVIDYLERDRRIPFRVLDSFVYPTAGRYLRAWATRIRQGLKDTPPGSAVEDALKQTYRETIGMFGRPTSRIARPDWRLTILDLARVNLLRKVDAVWRSHGELPMEVATDAVAYATWDEDPVSLAEALGYREGVTVAGGLRHTGTVPMPDYLADLAGPQTPQRGTQGADGPILAGGR